MHLYNIRYSWVVQSPLIDSWTTCAGLAVLPDRWRWLPHHVQSDARLEQGQEEAISLTCMCRKKKHYRNIIALFSGFKSTKRLVRPHCTPFFFLYRSECSSVRWTQLWCMHSTTTLSTTTRSLMTTSLCVDLCRIVIQEQHLEEYS